LKIVGKITDIERIAAGSGIHDLHRLYKAYGKARWRKLKGIARVQLPDGEICFAEVHWYEAHGIGRRQMKIKRLLRERP
jgi:hypothetical protein